MKDKGRRDYTLNPTTHGPTNGVQFSVPTDVSPFIAEAWLRAGGALNPIATYRASGYRAAAARERPAVAAGSGASSKGSPCHVVAGKTVDRAAV